MERTGRLDVRGTADQVQALGACWAAWLNHEHPGTDWPSVLGLKEEVQDSPEDSQEVDISCIKVLKRKKSDEAALKPKKSGEAADSPSSPSKVGCHANRAGGGCHARARVLRSHISARGVSMAPCH